MAESSSRARAVPSWLMAIWHSLLLPTHRHALGWWIGTRAALLFGWAILGFGIQGDIIYYYRSIAGLFAGSPATTVLVEYPTPLIWLLSIPYLLGFGTRMGYVAVFIILFVAGDALLGYMLWRSARQYGTNPRPAAAFWIWFLVAMGPIVYMRLDFLTAALSAVGLIAVVRRHRFLSGSMIGLGAAIKLWPALLWPTTMVDKKAVKRATIGFFGTGLILVLASLAYAGWDRLVSPLTWQSDRGLQIESVYALPVMLARLFNPDKWMVYLSRYNAYEIMGPGTVLLDHVSTVATVIGGIVIILLYIGWLRRKDRTPVEAGTLMVIATLIMIITNKTFSPQYIIWLAGPVAALLTISARHPDELPDQGRLFSWFNRPKHLTQDEHLVVPLTLARHIAIWTLAISILTQLVYPLLYGYLINLNAVTYVATVILCLRNVLLAYFSVRLIILAFRSIAFPRRGAITPATD